MTSPVCTLDLSRMRRERVEKLQAAMADAEVDTLLLCGQNNVSYANRARMPAADHLRVSWWRVVAVVTRDEPWPHLFTEFPEGSAPELPDGHIHPALEVEAAEGAAEVMAMLPAGRLALDDAPFPLWKALGDRHVVDAALVLGPAKLVKSLDELECIRQAQAINERAMRTVRAAARPGAFATDLSGVFLRTVSELGATSNTVDPVFQVMPRSVGAGPYSVTGDPVFPLPTQPTKLNAGEVMWVDSGINLHGYASDFGATWVIGNDPSAMARAQFEDWRGIVDRVLAVTKPGATGADLARAAGERNGKRPWLSYFYLADGIGTDPAEMPLIGTDRGTDFDASIVLQPGMVLVLEPVIWDDGEAGHRSEEIVAITETGYIYLSSRAELDGVGS